jgi:hypothetical protein
MKKVSFKKFLTFVDLAEDPSDEQIQEIFGFFQNNKKADELKKKRDALKAQQDAKRKEIQKKKDELWAAARDRVAGKTLPAIGIQPTGRTSQAAQGRAAERDWVASMANESVSPELVAELTALAKKIYDGDIEVDDILSHRVKGVSKQAFDYIQKQYDRACEGGRFHADDDFEDAAYEVGTNLIKDFVDPHYRG